MPLLNPDLAVVTGPLYWLVYDQHLLPVALISCLILVAQTQRARGLPAPGPGLIKRWVK